MMDGEGGEMQREGVWGGFGIRILNLGAFFGVSRKEVNLILLQGSVLG